MIVFPKVNIDIKSLDRPVIVFLGPDFGGGDWQSMAYRLLTCHLSRFYAVVPVWHPSPYLLSMPVLEGPKFPGRQTGWEREHIKLALELSKNRRGCVLVWLAEESREHPRSEFDNGQYGRDTGRELSRWGMYASMTNSHIVVGGERGFPGLSVAMENLRCDFGLEGEYPLLPTLRETVQMAVNWVK